MQKIAWDLTKLIESVLFEFEKFEKLIHMWTVTSCTTIADILNQNYILVLGKYEFRSLYPHK